MKYYHLDANHSCRLEKLGYWNPWDGPCMNPVHISAILREFSRTLIRHTAWVRPTAILACLSLPMSTVLPTEASCSSYRTAVNQVHW
uniref:Uncharacterized protein n=1 Tax=Mesocestoides corti TaxID=53468 RepID=A0A5K3EGA1_MESCO